MRIHTEHLHFGHQTTCEDTDTFALHCHPFHEIYYFVGGNVRYLVEGIPYIPAPHSLLLMASGVFHGILIETDAPYERYTLHFDPLWLPEDARAALYAPFGAQSPYLEGCEPFGILDDFKAIEACAGMPQDLRDIALRARVTSLLAQVCAAWRDKEETPLPQGEPIALGRQILAFINASLTSPLSLESIAQRFYISRNQLCRVFQRATGTTVGAYIRQKRLVLAGQLRAHGQSAGEAAVNAGFGDYSTYYRTHVRLMGHPPTISGARARGQAL